MNIAHNLMKKMTGTEDKRVSIVTLTTQGYAIGKSIRELLFTNAVIYSKYNHSSHMNPSNQDLVLINESAVETLQACFKNSDIIIAFMASGIVVRAIAPVIVDKTSDPAVIVMDDQGKHVISLLSGHVGRANHITNLIAETVGANPVITTATDVKGKVGLDDLAMRLHAVYDDFKAQTRRFNRLLIDDGRPLALVAERNYKLEPSNGYEQISKQEWHDLDPEQRSSLWSGLVVVSHHRCERPTFLAEDEELDFVHLIPLHLVLGVGCRKDTQVKVMQQEFDHFISEVGIDPRSIIKMASIDLKRNELAILELAKQLAVPFEVYTKDELLRFEHFYQGSPFVKQTVGVSSVAQTAAHKTANHHVIGKRYAHKGVTFALAPIKD